MTSTMRYHGIRLRPIPTCSDCGAELLPEKWYRRDAELCRRCILAREAGEDADLETRAS